MRLELERADHVLRGWVRHGALEFVFAGADFRENLRGGFARHPDAGVANRSSGNPTNAWSGAHFLTGAGWGTWEGALVVAALKDSQLHVMFFTRDGTFVRQEIPAELDGTEVAGSQRGLRGRWVQLRLRRRTPPGDVEPPETAESPASVDAGDSAS